MTLPGSYGHGGVMALDLEAARRWAVEVSTGIERQLADIILAACDEIERLREHAVMLTGNALAFERERDAAEADAALLAQHLRRWPHQHYGVECSICEALALHDARLTEREGD